MTVLSASGSSYVVAPTQDRTGPPKQPAYAPAQPMGNSTPTLCSLTVPNDGVPHIVAVTMSVNVTVTQVGGGLTTNTFNALGGANGSAVAIAGALTPQFLQATRLILVDPGGTVTVSQTAAMSAGTATMNAALALLS